MEQIGIGTVERAVNTAEDTEILEENILGRLRIVKLLKRHATLYLPVGAGSERSALEAWSIAGKLRCIT